MSDQDLTMLKRPKPPRAVISLVPMVDVMLILLVFFMVTSTYLNLDMIPAVQRAEDAQAAQPSETAAPATLLLQLGADGVPTVRGERLDRQRLEALFREFASALPTGRILVLPSGGADMQALISVMDTATRMGVFDLRVVRLEATE